MWESFPRKPEKLFQENLGKFSKTQSKFFQRVYSSFFSYEKFFKRPSQVFHKPGLVGFREGFSKI